MTRGTRRSLRRLLRPRTRTEPAGPYSIDMAFDVARIRGQFPALGDGWIHLDGDAGTLLPEQVASAVCSAVRAPLAAPGGSFPSARRTEHIAGAARQAVADLAAADPAGVVLGPSSAVLLDRLAGVLGQQWRTGDEVVVSRLDAETNIIGWQRAAQQAGAVLRWGEVDIETCDLPAWQYENIVGERTRVVAVTAASGSVGTRPDLATVVKIARRTDALVVVDASHAAGYVPINFDALDADVIAFSGRSWGGPDSGALVFRDPAVLDRLPAAAADESARGPLRLELGPQAYPQLAGLAASVDYLAALDDAATGARGVRVATSLRSLVDHHEVLLEQLYSELTPLQHVEVIGNAREHIPVLAFTVRGHRAGEVTEHLAGRGVCAHAESGTSGLLASLGVGEVGGAVRVGLAHYTNSVEISRFTSALAELG